MKSLRKSKGERLKWTPLKDVKPVKMTAENAEGKVVIVKVNDRRKLVIE